MIALALLLACGTERWPIKTASDSNAAGISTAPVAASIALLSTYPAQMGSDFDRIAPTELITYQLRDVTLVQFRGETDGDYHVVIGDGVRTMIVEIPDPSCVSPSSPLLAQITSARAQFDLHYAQVLPTPTRSSETVTVTGVGFYDDFHSQTGVAPNAIELHPLLSICFGAGCSPAATGTPPPPPSAPHGCASTPWLLLPLLLRRRRSA